MDKYIYEDDKYIEIVKDILFHEQFQKLKDIPHHGTNRYYHSLRVSYESYRIAKEKGLDYVSTARGGLLHDFFFENTRTMTSFEKKKNLQSHPVTAYQNALKYFSVNRIEKDIIIKHMYPVTTKLPKYKESYIVSKCDKKVSRFEVINTNLFKLKRINHVAVLILFITAVL